jgi:hypothetical protein
VDGCQGNVHEYSGNKNCTAGPSGWQNVKMIEFLEQSGKCWSC